MRERRLSDRGKTLYKQRKEHVERSFADSKNNHGYRYAMYRGIEKNQAYTWLICAAQNFLNNFVNSLKRNTNFLVFLFYIFLFITMHFVIDF